MEPRIDVNILAVLACVIVAMPVGFLWFGPLFGKPWARHMGMEDLKEPGTGAMIKSMALFALGNFLIAGVLAHVMGAYHPSSWSLGPDPAPLGMALSAAFWTWLGFFLPVSLGRVAWEGKGWGLVAINTTFDAVRLLLFALILAYWR